MSSDRTLISILRQEIVFLLCYLVIMERMANMDWIQSMQKAINYIEDNMLEELDTEKVAGHVYVSNANFQRIFSLITGITIGDYIRFRRLSLAGKELTRTSEKVIDIALKYGYDTAESFTKAFVRFHGITPSAAKKSASSLRNFTPFSIQIDIRGGFNMERRFIPNIPLITMSADAYVYQTSFIGALYGALIGVGEEYTHPELLAYSALGNRLCWTPCRWIFGNEMIENNMEYPFEAQNRTLNAIGWEIRKTDVERDIEGNSINITDEQIRRDYVDSINKGIPVLVQGITNDGCKHDYDVFFGYEDNGNKIIGWDYYQDDAEPFVREKWERELISYILLTKKTEPISDRERVINMFKSIVEYSRKKEIRGKKVAFAAWEAFLRDLEDNDFLNCSLRSSNDTPQVEKERQAHATGVHNLEQRFIIYCDALSQIFQRRELSKYFITLAPQYPEWSDELNSAANDWDECGKYGGYLWSQGFSFDEAGFKKFGDPLMRKILADEGRKAMQKDMGAIKQIEKILIKENLV